MKLWKMWEGLGSAVCSRSEAGFNLDVKPDGASEGYHWYVHAFGWFVRSRDALPTVNEARDGADQWVEDYLAGLAPPERKLKPKDDSPPRSDPTWAVADRDRPSFPIPEVT